MCTVLKRPHLLHDGTLMYQCRNASCARAGEWLPETEFYTLRNPASRCGRLSECKACMTRRRVQSRRMNGRMVWRERKIETAIRALRRVVAA